MREFTPSQIVDALDKYIIGQNKAKKMVDQGPDMNWERSNMRNSSKIFGIVIKSRMYH